MNILSVLQQHLGFTRSEILVIVFLAAALLVGVGVRHLSLSPTGQRAPRFDYSVSDSEYAARVRALAMLAPGTQPPGDPRGGVKGGGPKPRPAPGSIDINHADSAALIGLPGIGPAYARRIIAYRQAHGPFARIGDLMKVKGIGPARLARLKPFVAAR